MVPLTLAEVLQKPKGHEEFVLAVLGDWTGTGPQAWVHHTVQPVGCYLMRKQLMLMSYQFLDVMPAPLSYLC